ncbi:GAF domain/3'5'-cyclic nucleotide phosphodiesterase, putative [Angomonas deanei]|uniref:Phosphodiesterase n=1 Tax=Angomonas deanei TaxID=59799 RepID=A0A7G2CSH9_9TRYP|nr:GAF domain/3'5'-cyclic nucleotide phosphodiesterase, putative [Angomonas deanei]
MTDFVGDLSGSRHLLESFTLCESILNRYNRAGIVLSEAEQNAFKKIENKVSNLLGNTQNRVPNLAPKSEAEAAAPVQQRDTNEDLVKLVEKCVNVRASLKDIIRALSKELGTVLSSDVRVYYASKNDRILLDPLHGVAAPLDDSTALGKSFSATVMYTIANTLYIPLVSDGDFVGSVEAPGGRVDLTDRAYLEAILKVASVALRNCIEGETIHYETKKAEAMLSMATRLARDALDENVLIQSIMNTAKALTESDRCSMFIIKDENTLEAHFEDGNIVSIPTGTGIAGYVARTGDVVNIPNAYEDERFNRDVDKATGYRTKTILCLPVRYEGTIVAVAQLINKLDMVTETGLHLPRTFGKRDEELFETFSMFAAASLRNCRINDNLLGEKRKSDAILDVVTLLSNTDIRDVNGIVRHVLHGAKKLLNADRSSLFLLDKERNELYSRMADSVAGGEIRFPSGQGIAGTVAASGIGENIQDAYKDSRFNSSVDKQLGYRTQSILCEPIILNGEVLAVVQLVNKLEENGKVGKFTKQDQDTFKVFSLFAGISINNSHLLEFAVNAGKEAMELNEYRSNIASTKNAKVKLVSITEEEKNTVLSVEGIDQYDLTSLEFNLFDIREKYPTPLDAAAAAVYKLLLSTGLPQKFGCRDQTLLNFVLQCRKKYRFVPYHNFFHVVDVCQTLHTFLYVGKVSELLTELECFTLLATALVHDLDHMGVNNSFYLKTDSPLGILSSASGNNSVLEVHHCNLAIEILSNPDSDIFEGLKGDDITNAYRCMIDCVLATDMARHGELLKDFMEITDSYNKEDVVHRRKVMETMIKAADVSNVTKPFDMSRLWASAVTEEFYRQGDMEKAKGIEVLPMFDRSQNNELAKGQIGFIDFVAGKFFKEIVGCFFKDMQWCVDNITSNRAQWQAILDAK